MYKRLILVVLAVKGLTSQCFCESPSELTEKALDVFEQSMAYDALPARIPVRIVALHKLNLLGSHRDIRQTLLPAIEQATLDSHVAVRQAAVPALFSASPQRFWQVLPRIVDDDDMVRLFAAACVWKLHGMQDFEVPPSMVAQIQELCQRKQLGASELGFALLAKCFQASQGQVKDRAREVLTTLLSSRDPAQLKNAVEVAGLTNDPSFVPLVRSDLEDPRIRSIALVALIRLNHGLGTSLLLHELSQADRQRCLDAILVLVLQPSEHRLFLARLSEAFSKHNWVTKMQGSGMLLCKRSASRMSPKPPLRLG